MAWAVRKLSPGKNAAPSPPPVFVSEKTKNAVKNLEVDYDGKTGCDVISWADRVKGKTTVSNELPGKSKVRNTVECPLCSYTLIRIHQEKAVRK